MVVMVILQQTWVARLDAGDRVGGANSAEVWTVWGGRPRLTQRGVFCFYTTDHRKRREGLCDVTSSRDDIPSPLP